VGLWGQAVAGIANTFGARPIPLGPLPLEELPAAHLYRLLKGYYHSNSLYDELNRGLYDRGVWKPAMKPLRNPAFRVVEFYAATLWPGPLDRALPLTVKRDEIREPIARVWAWSNWAAQKQVSARQLAMLGDLFIKVVKPEDGERVYFQVIDPEHVSDFDTDERGFLTYIRVDVPQAERRGDSVKRVTHTEVWTKERYRLWVHDRQDGEEIDRLGRPRVEAPLSQLGIDFVPFVHAKFRDIGEARGQAAITPALDKIDEANLQATRLHQMLFRGNKNTWVLRANGVTGDGRPLPPPSIGGDAGSQAGTNTVTLGDDEVWRLPGTSELQSLVPNINYDAALAVLNAMIDELRRDLPELVYDELSRMDDASGVAVRLRMTGAIDRVLEARGNAEAALVRANQMALTIGASAGLFDRIGRFEDGDFEHGFAERTVVPETKQEAEQVALQRAQRMALLAEVLPAEELLRIAQPDWDEARIAAAVAAKRLENPSGGVLTALDAEIRRLGTVPATDEA
jgi:hypothetical protein